MFELSFGKMMIIAVVALIVLGPEKLPKVARTIGHLLGRARTYANTVKQDIDREMQMDELRKLQQQAQEAARSFETAVSDAGRSVEQEASTMQNSVNASLAQAESAALGNAAATTPPVIGTDNVIASPALPVAEPQVSTFTANDEIAALEKSIAEQATLANHATNATESKPIISPEQMSLTLNPTAPASTKKVA
ncbi:MAG TPA: Sec-independent protein translocase protein TatB [Casimicrobium sp.]|nr:Sec-independent protein translocase protein TatB [Casimicrobium sp.]